MAVIDRLVTGTFTGVGESESVEFIEGDVSISGTFSGTVQVQRFANGAWAPITDAEYTAPFEGVAENAKRRLMRIACTDYTSGTIEYSIG